MKKVIYIFIIIIFVVGFKESYSQNPTYELKVSNITFTNGCGYWNSIEFDIYMRNTGGVPLEYAAGQYFINFDPTIANGGTLTYEIVGSDLPANMLPRNPSVGTVSSPPGTALRLAANPTPLPGSGYIISSSFPGTKIVRMRLRTSAPEFVENLQPNFDWRNPPSLISTSIFAFVNGASTNITTGNTHYVETGGPLVCSLDQIPWCICRFTRAISINSIIEGLYNTETNRLNRKDTLTIELREGTAPYDIYSSQKLVLDSVNFSSYLVYDSFGPAGSSEFYIVIKHFNSIETWSKMPGVYYNNLLNYYDFTNSANSAYGDNLKLVGTKFTIYSGDVNQDKVIDVLDESLVDNGVTNYLVGRFIPEDLNGDNIVDGLDFLIADNNVYNYVAAITP